nr:hypothetical protein [Tanacetum cinerariifolium]
MRIVSTEMGLILEQTQQGISHDVSSYLSIHNEDGNPSWANIKQAHGRILKDGGEVKNASTPMETQKPLLKDEDGEEATGKAKTVNEEAHLQALVDGNKVIITESTIRRDLQLEDAEGVDCLPKAAIFEQLTLIRAATTATSLDTDQDIGRIIKTQSTKTLIKPVSQETSLDDSSRCQEAIGDAVAQTRSERVSKISNDPLLAGVNTPQSGEDSLKLTKLMELCFSARVESSKDEGLGEEDASKQERIANIDANKDIYLVNVHTDKDICCVNDDVIVEDVEMLFDVADDLIGEDVFFSQEVPLNAATATTTNATFNNITLAQALAELKSAKPKAATKTTAITITTASSRPKAKGIVIHDQEQAPSPTISLQQSSQVKDKGKGKMVKQEHVKKYLKKDQLMLDDELDFKLHAEDEEEERIAREKAQKIEEVNITWDDVQARINVDYELAQRLQAEEQDALTDAEKEIFFMEFLEKRRKFFAAKGDEEKIIKPPTKAH